MEMLATDLVTVLETSFSIFVEKCIHFTCFACMCMCTYASGYDCCCHNSMQHWLVPCSVCAQDMAVTKPVSEINIAGRYNFVLSPETILVSITALVGMIQPLSCLPGHMTLTNQMRQNRACR